MTIAVDLGGKATKQTISLNSNLKVRNERNMVIKSRDCTYKITHIVVANIPRPPHLVQT